MSGDIVIRAEGLGKKYIIGHEVERERYVALRDVLAHSLRNAFQKGIKGILGGTSSPGNTREEFWALKDISFEIKQGEVVGIIGRNGAGKSTLLKILSRITEPTEGRVTIKGRVASLLEVGTGFHPELTGRENIYLNGAILGMTRAEVKRKFDEIVSFSEVEKFLDTPVKRYSSGMYVRLAFAVAAHLEPEILIIDEVLAVGDAEFQKKCLGKMSEVAGGGRTVLYVSHNIQSMTSLCQRGLVLEAGKIIANSTIAEAVAKYTMRSVAQKSASPHVLFEESPGDNFAEGAILRVEMLDKDNRPQAGVSTCGPVTFRVSFRTREALAKISVLISIRNIAGVKLVEFESDPSRMPRFSQGGDHYLDCRIGALPLMPGQYFVSIGLAYYGVTMIDWKPDAGTFYVSDANDPELPLRDFCGGALVVPHRWTSSIG